MIKDSTARIVYNRDILPLIGPLRGAFVKVTERLRDTDNFEFWTEAPSDRTRRSLPNVVSLEGFRVQYAAIAKILTDFLQNHTAFLTSFDSDALDEIEGFLESWPIIEAAFVGLADTKRTDGNLLQCSITSRERTDLATIIEGQIE